MTTNAAPPRFGRYRIPSARKPAWDYGSPVWYFVTICTRNRERCFGRIEQGTVRLSTAGQVVEKCWRETGEIRPEVQMGSWVIMPEHFHGLIRPNATVIRTDMECRRPTEPLPAWRPGTLGAIINHFKRAVTMDLRAVGVAWPGWQPRFHDRIIHDAKGLAAVERYIARNPAMYRVGRSFR